MTDATRARQFICGDHVELAKALLLDLRCLGRPVYAKGTTWCYDEASGVYIPVTTSEQSRMVQAYSKSPLLSGGTLKLKRSDVSGSIKLAQDQIADENYFDRAPKGIAFANGFVEVTANGVRLLEHSQEHRAMFAHPFDYKPYAEGDSPQWHAFLHAAFLGDPDAEQKIDLIHEFTGAAMLGIAPQFQKALFFRGTEDGSNAKSKLLEAIEAIMPPNSTVAISPKDMANPCYLARLHGKLLNAVTELPQATVLETNIFKAVVTGDRVEAKPLYKDPYNFLPIAGHIFAVNKLPRVDDLTNAYWRRILVLAFNRSFENDPVKDGQIISKILRAEKPAMIALALQYGAKMLKALEERRGYTVPDSHNAELSTWKLSIDSVRAFLKEECEPCEHKEGAQAAWALQHYKTWANAEGLKAVGRNEFRRRCERAGYVPKHFETGWHYPFKAAYVRPG